MPASAPRRKPSVPAAHPDIEADFTPLLAERHVALAVSGGSDSTALMCLAARWARTHHPHLTTTVLTVDHRLRPEAAGEAAEVASWAAKLGLAHQVLHWDDEPKPVAGIQAAARAARYGLMAKWCRAHGATALLTAHTLDDQAETVLMRLSRTISPESLAGIRPAGNWDGLPVLRPLLGFRRQVLRAWLAARGQSWIEDPSNDDPRFERVRARHTLGRLGEPMTLRLAALADRSVQLADLLERLARRWIATSVTEHEAGICHLPAKPFTLLPMALQERILALVIARYGGGQPLPEPEELRRACHWAAASQGPVRCTLGGALLGRRKTSFWVTRESARIAKAPQVVPPTGKVMWDNRFLVEAAPGARVTPAAQRKLPAIPGVPVYAQKAFPWVEQPAGAPAPRISFLRLNASP